MPNEDTTSRISQSSFISESQVTVGNIRHDVIQSLEQTLSDWPFGKLRIDLLELYPNFTSRMKNQCNGFDDSWMQSASEHAESKPQLNYSILLSCIRANESRTIKSPIPIPILLTDPEDQGPGRA
ncbi:hypothetical protein ABEW05_011029 [Botrytis cinerea]